MFQINQLIIVGGPSCAGKTFLIEKIKKGDCTRLCEQLGIGNPSSWIYVGNEKLLEISKPIVERIVVHYDFYIEYIRINGFKYLHELISNSDSVIVLTLCVSSKILIQRNTLRFIKLFASLLRKPKAYRKKIRQLRRTWNRQNTYKDEFSMLALYVKWFDALNEYSVTSYYLDSGKPKILMAHPYETDKIGLFTGVQEVLDS